MGCSEIGFPWGGLTCAGSVMVVRDGRYFFETLVTIFALRWSCPDPDPLFPVLTPGLVGVWPHFFGPSKNLGSEAMTTLPRSIAFVPGTYGIIALHWYSDKRVK